MRTFFYWLGLIVIAAGVGTLLWDLIRWAGADAFFFSSLGDIWALVDRDSLLLLEPALVRHVAPWTWEDLVFPLLQQPALLVLGLLGLALMLLSRLFARRY
ncbi:MAG: hypothetical protein Kilf2KO_34670 [Rhodospirillales bacterium]